MSKTGIVVNTMGALLAMAACSLADSVLLKNGELIEGKIVAETETTLTLLVNVTATIKDDLIIKKGEIEKTVKVPPDDEAWIPLARLSLGQESLDSDDYESVIASFRNFLKRFPTSSHAPDARQKIEKFQAELKRVEAGEVKVDGVWMDRGRVMEERIQIGGRILFIRMKRYAFAGQAVEAMGVFDILEKQFGGSASFPDAVMLARQLLPMIGPAVQQRQAELQRRIERDKVRMTIAKGAEREQLDGILKQDRAAMEAAVTAAERNGVKWLPLNMATETSLKNMATRISSEMARLNTIAVDKMKLSMLGTEAAAIAIGNRDIPAAEKALAEAKTAWPLNDRVIRLEAQLADAKKAEIAAKAAKAAASRATPTPAPQPLR
jgi:hypothetical protein